MDYVNYAQYAEYEEYSAYSGEFRKDFGKNEADAKEFSKLKYEELKNKIKEQAKVLDEFKKNDYAEVKRLNAEMNRKTFESIKEKHPELVETHDKIEKLMKYADKSEAGQVVYLSLSAKYIGKSKSNYFNFNQNENKIDREKLKKFIDEESGFANYSGYMVASLHSMSLDLKQGDRMLIPVQLAKGTSMLHLGDGNVIIDKDIPMQKIDVSVVAYKGMEVINWKLRQISEDSYEKLIEQAEDKLNTLINKRFLVTDFNRITFDLNSMGAASAATIASPIVENFADTIPREVFISLCFTVSHISNTHFRIVFSDRQEGAQTKDTTLGQYYYEENELYIYPINVPLDTPNDYQELLDAGIHEFAHALDYTVFYNMLKPPIPPNVEAFSETDEFKDLFNKESNNLTEETSWGLYGRKDSTEYFAEVFIAMHSKDDNIKSLIRKQVPETYKYITEYIDKIKVTPF